ncbi:hypothetical protein [Mycobacterium sp. 852014-52144_SCH5372336]|uniref:hypothetical protein n=1 Tax=Mycobacterium sp. 852014-52144_SCH5372336 TaxID=1834115 RepID=UPI000AD1EA40|nr:hypothetical protein [Mycobacterium sp. 852014-52144_SCH5372336]
MSLTVFVVLAVDRVVAEVVSESPTAVVDGFLPVDVSAVTEARLLERLLDRFVVGLTREVAPESLEDEPPDDVEPLLDEPPDDVEPLSDDAELLLDDGESWLEVVEFDDPAPPDCEVEEAPDEDELDDDDEDEDDPESPDPDGVAPTGAAATAAPTPKANARAPTRPTCCAYPMVTPP